MKSYGTSETRTTGTENRRDQTGARHFQGSGSGNGGKRKKQRRRLRPRDLLLVLIPVVAVATAASLILYFTKDVNTLSLESGARLYYGGGAYPLQEGSVLRRTSEGLTVQETADGDNKMSSLPIYYEGERRVTLPQDMAYYAPRSGESAYAQYFTEAEVSENDAATLSRDRQEVQVQPGFLYDGGDLYLFLEPMVVSFNGYEIELPALSYVEAVYTADVMVFDFGTGEFFIEAPSGDVTAAAATGDYTVSLVGDSVTTRDGKRTLLVAKPDVLEPIQ